MNQYNYQDQFWLVVAWLATLRIIPILLLIKLLLLLLLSPILDYDKVR